MIPKISDSPRPELFKKEEDDGKETSKYVVVLFAGHYVSLPVSEYPTSYMDTIKIYLVDGTCVHSYHRNEAVYVVDAFDSESIIMNNLLNYFTEEIITNPHQQALHDENDMRLARLMK